MVYDLVVIGAGPAGYSCAIKAAQLKNKVAIVEKEKTYGGTCLNIGCIPSKALLHTSEVYNHISKGIGHLGIGVSSLQLDLEKMMSYKRSVVQSNVQGIDFLLKKNKITAYQGLAKVISANKISIKNGSSEEIIEAKNIVLATGSETSGIPGMSIDFDEQIIVSSTGALSLGSVPKNLLVIGAGVIGLELGSVWMRLGSRVKVIEYSNAILNGMDKEIAGQFLKIISKQGMDFQLSSKVLSVKNINQKAQVIYQSIVDDKSIDLESDVVLIAAGRKPYTEGLGLEEIGIGIDKRGCVEIGKDFQTSVPGIYAIGDVVRGPMLAHKSEDEGIAVAEIISGQKGHVNYAIIPNVVYTHPEIASVGKTEEQLKSEGQSYKVGKFPFSANGRARSMNSIDGFVKILADQKSDRVEGVHIIGVGAGEMIHEAAVLMEFGGSSEDLARICHAHPTMSEAIREAALACFDRPIHL
ncbi:dihydrolipoamide dehydrogenase [Candidatus Liberibacter solanacearum]|uniref:dihydrolipoyl dehydrogenase n=1 Tax=Candidatus Liberibacter solanacearum TaxID=556287 RepID=UPI0005FA16AA|nr:dihydrolipoyl dehydrogenase [Candidatus Liberibacter solanacearum]KJZ81432.1 dihydrolipoamide dehydrogenase [Candidatus Liberibacter solanacearum]KQC49066.1 dihydrolipoamide dehydrogenase [Candidatus Liberibacter solanacearum]